MANTKSALKRIKISERKRKENVSKKTRVKNALKKFNAAIAAKDIESAEKLLPLTVSLIDKAKSDGVYPDNTASRKVATISRALSALKDEGKQTEEKQ